MCNKQPIKRQLLLIHFLLAHLDGLLQLHALASRLDRLDLLHDRRALLLQHAQRLSLTLHCHSHSRQQRRCRHAARRFHREDEIVPDHVQLHEVAILGQANALSAHSTPHSHTAPSRAVQVVAHHQRGRARQVLDVEHAHGAGAAQALGILASDGRGEGDLRAHTVGRRAHGRPLGVRLADALRGVALAVHALGVREKRSPHLSGS